MKSLNTPFPRFFFLFLFLCSFSIGFSQNTCYLRVNLNDCINCLGQIKQIQHIDESLSTSIILEEKHKQYAKKYLKHQLDLDIDELTVLYSDEWYNKLGTGAISSVHVINEEETILFEGELKKLSDYITTINSFAGQNASKKIVENSTKVSIKNSTSSNTSDDVLLQLPQSVLLSSEYYVIPFSDGYYLHDFMFNQLYQFSKDGAMKTISAKSIDKKALHQKTFGHLKHHRATIFYDEILTQLNQKNIIIESAAEENGILYAIVKLPYPVVETQNGQHALIVKAKYIMLEFQEMELAEIYPIDMLSNSEYSVDPVSFEVENGAFVLSLFKSKFNQENYILGNFSKSTEGLVFKDFAKAQVPTFFKEKELVYEYFNSMPTDNYLFFEYGNNYVDLKKGKEFTLPKAIVDFSTLKDFKNFQVLASQSKGQEMQILFLKNGEYYSSSFNAKSTKVKTLQTLKLPKNIATSPSNWVFNGWNEVLVMNNDNQIVRIPLDQSNSLSLQDENGNSKNKTERHP